MARDVLSHSCMCASGELHLHAGPVQSQDGRRGSADAPAERLLKIREALLDRIWRGMFAVALVAAPVSVSRAFFTGWFHMYSVHLAVTLLIVVVYWNRARVPFVTKSVLVFVIIWSVGLAGLLTMGLLSAGYWWLVMSSLLGPSRQSRRSGRISC